MKKLLFIDDDADDRYIFQTAIQELNVDIEYIEAKDGQEALDLIGNPNFTPPDIIFVDLNMPRVTGLEFVIRMKKLPLYHDIPTYIYTTSGSANERVNCFTAGASGYIIKHAKFKDLANELSVLVTKHKLSA